MLSGRTIADQNITINGSSVVGLRQPSGIALYGVDSNESLVIADSGAGQVVHMKNINSNDTTISAIGCNSTNGTRLFLPYFVSIDSRQSNDLYVTDFGFRYVMRFSPIQMNNPPPQTIRGINQTNGPGLYEMTSAMGIAVDRNKNLYVADYSNHRILRLAPNASAGIIIAGNGTAGSDSMSLNTPAGIYLDENNSLLYVADYNNNRIQAYDLIGIPPHNGTTVAGGNGAGSGSHQFKGPFDVWVSKKSKVIYISDLNNHRIQRWTPGASRGVTVAGSISATSGSNATRLNTPNGIVINSDETRMYVSDRGNKRVQCFNLI